MLSQEQINKMNAALGKKTSVSSPAQYVKKQGVTYSGGPLSADQIRKMNELVNKNKPKIPTPTQQNAPTLGERLMSGVKKFGSDVVNTVKERAGDIKQTFGRTTYNEPKATRLNPLEVGVQTVGNVIGGAFDIAGHAVGDAASAVAPEATQNLKDRFAENLKNTNLIGTNKNVPQLAQDYSDWAAKHPRASKDLEGVLNIASVIPGYEGASAAEKVATGAIKEAAPIVEGTAKRLGEGLATKSTKKAAENVIEATRPVLNAAEKRASIASGNLREGGILRKTTLEPTARDIEIANTVQKEVGSLVPGQEAANIKKVKGAISREGDAVRASFANENPTFNVSKLREYLGKVKENSKVIYGSDKTLENVYDTTADELLKHLKTEKNLKFGEQSSAADLWDARQAFDDIVEEKFPNVFSGKESDNVRRNAILDMRKAANDFISEQLPEGNLFKSKLKTLTHMYEAVDNIAGQAVGKVGKTTVQRAVDALRAHPVSTGLGGLATGATIVGVGLPTLTPAAITALATYGTYRLGKKILTSEALSSAILGSLKIIEKKAATASGRAASELASQKSALQEILKAIGGVGVTRPYPSSTSPATSAKDQRLTE